MSDRFRVVLIEDDAALRRLTRAVLERSGGFQVVGEAEDGRAGIAITEQVQPQLVLLDLAMPKMGGLEALPKLLQVAPAAKIVAVSMLRAEQFASKVVSTGAVAFIDKSVSSTELVQRLMTIMRPETGSSNGAAPPPGRMGVASLGPTIREWIERALRKPYPQIGC